MLPQHKSYICIKEPGILLSETYIFYCKVRHFSHIFYNSYSVSFILCRKRSNIGELSEDPMFMIFEKSP